LIDRGVVSRRKAHGQESTVRGYQHFFSVDLKDGKALGIQADKGDYRRIAGMLESFANLPIQVTAKDSHFLAGFNTQIEAGSGK